MLKTQPILMFGTILAWAWGIYSLAIQLPIWGHSVGAFLLGKVGME